MSKLNVDVRDEVVNEYNRSDDKQFFLIVGNNSRRSFELEFKKLLKQIECKNCTLVITDEYFHKQPENVADLNYIINAINEEEPQKVILLCQDNENNLSNLRNKEFRNNHPAIHDRFYINVEKNKAFFIGTSINGLFRKICLMDTMSECDAKDIISILKEHIDI